MSAVIVSTVGHGSTSLWYLTRATGLVSFILLSSTLVLGIVSSLGWTRERWPRFLSQAVHRNLSLFCIALVGIHIITTIGDGYVPIGFADAIIPFRSPYRPIWVGFGALAFNMLLAVGITSGLRRRIGVPAWRGVHWLAYACWPIALVHALGSGTDARLPGTIAIFVGCVAAVVGATAWRLVSGRVLPPAWRLGGGIVGTAVLLATIIFAAIGPLGPGWSHRAGTSPALLAQLNRGTSQVGAAAPNVNSASAPTASTPAAGLGIPAIPFSTSVTGTFSTSAPNDRGLTEVLLTMSLADTSSPLQVRIIGPAVDGGVSMERSSVTFGNLSGVVTALQGSTIGAALQGPSGSFILTMNLNLQQSTGTLSGNVTGSAN